MTKEQSLLNGFRDIVTRTNLTTNGAFRINQRNQFTNWEVIQNNDFISDCWMVNSTDVDIVECKNTYSEGYISFRGRAKAKQEIKIHKSIFSKSLIIFSFSFLAHVLPKFGFIPHPNP